MATRKIPNADGIPDTTKITVEFDNGDLQAMNTVKNEWHFIDEANLLRFALAVLSRAKNKKVYVEDAAGNKFPIAPGQQLLKPEATSAPAPAPTPATPAPTTTPANPAP